MTSSARRVAIVERNSQVGGVAINTGAIPSKALRHAAFEFRAQRRTGDSAMLDHRLLAGEPRAASGGG